MEIETLRGEFRNSIQDMGRLTPMPRIYGRDAEIATLVEALDLAASGRLAVVLIEGEAGIGKSPLLEEALQSARGRGIQVTAGRAEEEQRKSSLHGDGTILEENAGVMPGGCGCPRFRWDSLG